MARSGIKGYDVLITGDKKIPADDTDKTELKVFLNWGYSTRHLTMNWYSQTKT